MLLADAMDTAHPLFQPDQRPRDIPVDQNVRDLQVDAFVARVSGDDHLEPGIHEPGLNHCPFGMVVRTGVALRCEANILERSDEPVSGVGVLGEHNKLIAQAGADPVLR